MGGVAGALAIYNELLVAAKESACGMRILNDISACGRTGFETYHGDNKKYITKDIDEDPFAP